MKFDIIFASNVLAFIQDIRGVFAAVRKSLAPNGIFAFSAETIDLEDGEQEDHEVKKKIKRKKNELEVECKVLITAGHRDVDQDVFLSIHNNGLVYNGRLIVDKSF